MTSKSRLISILCLVHYLTPLYSIDCVLEYFLNYTQIEQTTCHNADLCYYFQTAYLGFLRRGCIRGFKYFPVKYGCYYDPIFLNSTRLVRKPPDPAGILCFCNTTNCNVSPPVVWLNGTGGTTIHLLKKPIPLIAMPYIDCYNFGNMDGSPPGDFYEPKKTKKLTVARELKLAGHVNSPICTLMAGLIDQAGDGEIDRMVWTSTGSFTASTHQFFRIYEGRPDFPPYYPGLLTSYQYMVDQIVVQYACYSPKCNSITDLTYMLKKKGISCYLSTVGTCKGELCFWAMDYLGHGFRGCLSQDASKSVGRIEVGQMTFTSTHYFCAEDYCNQDLESTETSAKKFQPKWSKFKPSNSARQARKLLLLLAFVRLLYFK